MLCVCLTNMDKESDINSILKEIETQQEKPLKEQLNDLKIAGAKVINSLDNIINNLDTILNDDNDN